MNTISVSTLVRYLKNKLDSDNALANVHVSGELSNFNKAVSGHLYFTLKDESCAINCVMFRSKASSITFNPKNGDKVIISGSVSLFEANGQLQVYVNTLKLDGIGDLYAKYEELKNKLYKEGLFSDEHKKQVPTFYPEKVAVLCGDNSAAMSDIKIQFKRRWPLCSVDYYPVLVQGIQAPKNIIETLDEVDNLNYEIIVLARGGGSFEDLFCFNDEQLVRCIYSLKTYIVTGIGHEQDFSLCDFVADLRAPTPTGAIELITPKINDVKLEISDLNTKMFTILNDKVFDIKDTIYNLCENKYLSNPVLLVDKSSLKLDFYLQKLNNYSTKCSLVNNKIDNALDKMISGLKIKLTNKNNELNKFVSLLNVYSLDNTLKRGFSLVYKGDKLLKDDININDDLTIETFKQKIDVKVEKVGKRNG